MKVAKIRSFDTAPMVALLEDAFAPRGGRRSGAHGVPSALWEVALLGPLREMLARPGKELRARLVQLGFELGGGNLPEMPEELPWLIELIHIGSLVIDDIEDDSAERRGAPTLHRLHGVPVALNAGNWLYFWPQVLLGRMQLPAAARLEAHERIAECMLRCHEGQALDLTVRVDALARDEVSAVVSAIATLKTGQLAGLATALGAVAALSTSRRVDALARFGTAVGVGLQMLDDLSGVLNAARRDKGIEDLTLGRATFVWALLSELLDDEGYARTRDQGRDARAGDARAAEALLASARFRLAMTGVRRVRRHFDEAVGGLESSIEAGSWLKALRSELAWLERRFLEAP